MIIRLSNVPSTPRQAQAKRVIQNNRITELQIQLSSFKTPLITLLAGQSTVTYSKIVSFSVHTRQKSYLFDSIQLHSNPTQLTSATVSIILK